MRATCCGRCKWSIMPTGCSKRWESRRASRPRRAKGRSGGHRDVPTDIKPTRRKSGDDTVGNQLADALHSPAIGLAMHFVHRLVDLLIRTGKGDDLQHCGLISELELAEAVRA